MISARKGEWLQTFSGRPFWPLDPRAEDVDIEDIAHSLGMSCRYGGHCTKFYSVAEHSVHVSLFVPQEFALWGLLHDAPEAYTSDIPRPLKRCLPDWKIMENVIMNAICDKFGLEYEEPPVVKQIDLAMTTDERIVLMNKSDLDWGYLPGPIGAEIKFLSPEESKRAFLDRFNELTN